MFFCSPCTSLGRHLMNANRAQTLDDQILISIYQPGYDYIFEQGLREQEKESF